MRCPSLDRSTAGVIASYRQGLTIDDHVHREIPKFSLVRVTVRNAQE